MKMNRKIPLESVILLIIFILYSILFFAVPFPKTAAAWWSYMFAIVSFVVGNGIVSFVFRKGEDIKSKVYGFPLLRLGVIYVVAQTIFSLTICIVGFLFIVPAWIVIIISVIFVAFTAVGVLFTEVSKNIIEKQEQEIKNQTKTIRFFKYSIEGIVDLCHDEAMKRQISALADELRYSDPVSCDKLEGVEGLILDAIEELRRAVKTEDKILVSEIVDELSQLTKERNRLCKAMK